MPQKFILLNRSAFKKGGRNLGIVELEDGFEGEPIYLSTRSKGVSRIMKMVKHCYVGKTERSKGYQILTWFKTWTKIANDNERLWDDDLLVSVVDIETNKQLGYGLQQTTLISDINIVSPEEHCESRIYKRGEQLG